MTWRRLRAVPALAGIALLLTLPFGFPGPAAAVAATASTAASTAESQSGRLEIAIDTPAAGQKLTTPRTTVSGAVTSRSLVSAVTYVTYVEVAFLYNGSLFHTAVVCDGCDNRTSVPFSVPSPALDLNGPYSVEVRAAGKVILQGLSVDGAATRRFAVVVPPAPPTNVAAMAQPDRSVKLSWTAAPTTADFLGYVVYRKTGSGPLTAIGVTKQTNYTDTQTSELEGPIQYQVASVREGAVPGNPETAVQTPSTAVTATLPALPTTSTVPGATTTTVPVGGGNQEGGAASVNLADLLPSRTTPAPTFPPSSPPPTLPDTGFDVNLPFPSTSLTVPDPTKVEGRQLGNGRGNSAAGELGSDSGDDTNRRALLIPVAAGSVLCVTALHLRWLNRRVVSAAALGAVTGLGGEPGGGADLPPLPPEPEPEDTSFLPDVEPLRVGAGSPR